MKRDSIKDEKDDLHKALLKRIVHLFTKPYE